MTSIKSIIQSPKDRQVESERPYNEPTLDGIIRAIEKLKRITDNLQTGPDATTGDREPFAHNHGYGKEDFNRAIMDRENADFQLELIGRHIPKQIMCQTGGSVPITTIPSSLVSSTRENDYGANITQEFPRYFPGPGTTIVRIDVGVKSSGAAFDVMFSPVRIDKATYDAGVFTTIEAAGTGDITWLENGRRVRPYGWLSSHKLYFASTNQAPPDKLEIYAIRIYEVLNRGVATVGFQAGIHQAGLHKIGVVNIPGRRTL